jgi:hypothetical protein
MMRAHGTEQLRDGAFAKKVEVLDVWMRIWLRRHDNRQPVPVTCATGKTEIAQSGTRFELADLRAATAVVHNENYERERSSCRYNP